MSTKLKGDIAEQVAAVKIMRLGWSVLNPVGDRLPYDLVADINGTFVRLQVKSAWLDQNTGNYVVDNRRTKTNRRLMKREKYGEKDFDFALVFIDDLDLFYVFPVEVFNQYGSEIHMVETNKRQRKPRSSTYRDAWHLISHWASQEEILARTPVKFGEATSGVIPSQAQIKSGKV